MVKPAGQFGHAKYLFVNSLRKQSLEEIRNEELPLKVNFEANDIFVNLKHCKHTAFVNTYKSILHNMYLVSFMLAH